MKKIPVLCLLIPALAAAEMRSVKVDDFNISGIKIGMTPTEAVSAAKSYLGFGEEYFYMDYELSRAAEGRKRTHPAFIIIKPPNGKGHIEIRLLADVLHDKPDQWVVTGIVYKLPDNEANRAEIEEQTLAKFGNPSYTIEETGKIMRWCEKPENNGCTENLYGQAVLELDRTVLFLGDFRYLFDIIDKNNEELRAWWENQQENRTLSDILKDHAISIMKKLNGENE